MGSKKRSLNDMEEAIENRRFETDSGNVNVSWWRSFRDPAKRVGDGYSCSLSIVSNDGVMICAVVHEGGNQDLVKQKPALKEAMFTRAKSILSEKLLKMASDIDSIKLP